MCVRCTLSLYHKALAYFWGDKVSMLVHTYLHKALRKIKVNICIHQADSLLYMWPDV